MKLRYLLIVFCCLPVCLLAQQRTALHGQWSFALDPVHVGEAHAWYGPDFPLTRWDKVTVPHCFSVDPRYMLYTGTAWYVKKFQHAAVPAGHRAYLRFEAVFYKAQAWLNGQQVGAHEGGYTPFELDITEALKGENTLALQVNNAWDTTTIPGAKTRIPDTDENTGQLFPWINYGGITREVYVVVRPEVYVQNVKITADPDLTRKTAKVALAVHVRNASGRVAKPAVQVTLYRGVDKVPVKIAVKVPEIPAGATTVVQAEAVVPAKEVKLWYPDDPVLYKAEVVTGADTLSRMFGIRQVAVQGTQLLLNGEPIRMGGCNRPLDYPGYGSMDPTIVLEKDLTLIKNGSMELSRISHYPVSTQLLDWADAHGLLIIAEAGNWQLTPKQMADPAMRARYQAQLREMMERDWNHPSVIAWSVGNEYHSHKPEGQAWTKDMYAYVKSIDASRLVTFASMFVFRDIIQKPEDEASQYVDFVSANIYGDHLKNLKHIHALYPNKPVYISEFGLRTDGVKDEQDRVRHLQKAMQDFRQCDFLVGASVWTFNDYMSRFPGTNPNGYRPWGLISPERDLRGMYLTWQEEFAPATLAVKVSDKQVAVTVTARNDFPRYTLRNYTVQCGSKSAAIDMLKPGESKTLTLEVAPGAAEVSLVKPGGFVVVKKSIHP
ncbi:beta galactosidase jelly roll domain-containing protein [Fulvivirgaceae bacterium PWU5]|uniref:Beta galactosidase jelly roll domain-containing protein n=1 Tax=Dawidia cretensis TaxID=2782350 RepID=A0AAP2GTN4_9BACT|nr:glycoside hydrolase family 2 TIM barrel-domain containing protein [Dawidia cretensis]MBT1706617.1 beta galactosidase jelly roll domain-containing protein [Dawidia cretensis]